MSGYRDPQPTDVVVFDGMSDVPGSEIAKLSWEELKLVFEYRYAQAGAPHDRLRGWLNSHYVGSPRSTIERRVMNADWFGMCALLHEAGHWVTEAREEVDPPRSDLA